MKAPAVATVLALVVDVFARLAHAVGKVVWDKVEHTAATRIHRMARRRA